MAKVDMLDRGEIFLSSSINIMTVLHVNNINCILKNAYAQVNSSPVDAVSLHLTPEAHPCKAHGMLAQSTQKEQP